MSLLTNWEPVSVSTQLRRPYGSIQLLTNTVVNWGDEIFSVGVALVSTGYRFVIISIVCLPDSVFGYGPKI